MRLITDDSYTDGLRQETLPLWDVLTLYQQDEFRKVVQAQAKMTLKEIRERITKHYLNDDCGVSKSYSRTARYAVAKEIVLDLVLLEIVNESQLGE